MRIQLPISVFSLILLSCFSASAQIDKGVISGEVADRNLLRCPAPRSNLNQKSSLLSRMDRVFSLLSA